MSEYTILYGLAQSLFDKALGVVGCGLVTPSRPIMVQQPPRLILILAALTNVVASRHHPLHPTARTTRQARQVILDTLRINTLRTAVLIKPEFRQQYWSFVYGSCIAFHSIIALIPEAAFDVIAVCSRVLIVVEFPDYFVGVGVRGFGEVSAVADVLSVYDGGKLGVVIQPREENQGGSIGFVDTIGCWDHVLIPTDPAVSSAVCGGA